MTSIGFAEGKRWAPHRFFLSISGSDSIKIGGFKEFTIRPDSPFGIYTDVQRLHFPFGDRYRDAVLALNSVTLDIRGISYFP